LTLLSRVVRDVYFKHGERFLPMYRAGVFDPQHHRRAVAAIRARDPVTAAAEMRAHALSALGAADLRAPAPKRPPRHEELSP
jgi:DNA-binding GntR family transcriptional regulator